MKKAIFSGTFDPFTFGHASIVEKGLKLVDEVIIAIGVNDQKKTCFSLEKRLESIRALYKDEPKVQVCAYNTLTVDLAETYGAQFLLRGVRSVIDFEYEKNIADVNRSLSGLETVILFTQPEHAHISSSVVRELLRYGKEVSAFMPLQIIESTEK